MSMVSAFGWHVIKPVAVNSSVCGAVGAQCIYNLFMFSKNVSVFCAPCSWQVPHVNSEVVATHSGVLSQVCWHWSCQTGKQQSNTQDTHSFLLSVSDKCEHVVVWEAAIKRWIGGATERTAWDVKGCIMIHAGQINTSSEICPSGLRRLRAGSMYELSSHCWHWSLFSIAIVLCCWCYCKVCITSLSLKLYSPADRPCLFWYL